MKKISIVIITTIGILIFGLIGYIGYEFRNFGAGTLGGFELRTFPVSKSLLVKGIDSLYTKHPKYIIPEDWESLNDWSKRGYDFLDSRVFYFEAEPKEIYYVTFYGDANDSVQADETKTSISLRAYRSDTLGWTLEGNCSNAEKKKSSRQI